MGNLVSDDQRVSEDMLKNDETIYQDHKISMMETIDFRNNRICKAVNNVGETIIVKTISRKFCDEHSFAYPPTEIDVMKKLQHTNIVKFHSAVVLDNFAYIFMEYVSGGDFVTFMEHRNCPLDEYCAKKYWVQMARPIQYLHAKGICHRDVKPENYIVCGMLSSLSSIDKLVCLKLTDFEYACEFTKGTKLTRYCGSPDYASPELIEGIPYPGPDVDVWALGVTLYIMLTYKIPFNSYDRSICRWPEIPIVSDFAKSFIAKIFVTSDDRANIDTLMTLIDDSFSE